jgi:hypothetical protein
MGKFCEQCGHQRPEEANAQEIAGLAKQEELDDDDDKNNLTIKVSKNGYTHGSIRKVSNTINPQSAVAASILRRISMNTALNARDSNPPRSSAAASCHRAHSVPYHFMLFDHFSH